VDAKRQGPKGQGDGEGKEVLESTSLQVKLSRPSMSQSSQRKGWLLARSEALATAQRAMNTLAPSDDMSGRI
jgi:hypothetical protein